MREDVIAAIATAPGDAGIAIVRLSGNGAHDVIKRCFSRPGGGDFPPGRLCYGHVFDREGALIDEGMAVFMKAPHSYTCEDVCEIQCHGGRVCAARVLETVLAAGARLAQPGEFTRRAFLNGRMDLSEAEAVMSLIGAGSEAAARAAVRQLGGGVSRMIETEAAILTDLLSLIAASDDFPEEIEEQAARDKVLYEVDGLIARLNAAADERGARLIERGASVVLAGRPNTGKSSLMNALTRSDRAIVTGIPGTTRDTLTENMTIGGLLIALTDTAGQRAAADEVERMGVERARQAEERADVVLAVFDGAQDISPEDEALLSRADARYIAVVNKGDQAQVFPLERLKGIETAFVSAQTGAGIEDVLARIEGRLAIPGAREGMFTSARHIACARAAIAALERARDALGMGIEVDVCACDIQQALEHLFSITGKNAAACVIDHVFALFCVGK